MHWRALTVLDKLHKRDRRVREKSIAEYARDASKGAAGLLHRLTKPRPVWCPRDAAQGEATNPRDAAELAANSWSRIWRVHVEELQNADRPWETPNGEDMSVMPQLEVEGPSGFDAVVGSFKANTQALLATVLEANCLLMDPCCASTDRRVDTLDGH